MGFKLSHSSKNELDTCPRKFIHRKVLKTEPDPDYEDNTKALSVGKAFHETLEACNHEKGLYEPHMLEEACENNGLKDVANRGLVLGMVQKYFILHQKSGLKVKACEIAVTDDYILGYVDAIMTDDQGNWWVVDLKTAGKLANSLLARLKNDPQLNLYSYFAPQIAEGLGLDLKKFSGIRYRVTLKTTIRAHVGELLLSYARRVFDKIESFDIGIPKEHLKPENAYRIMRGAIIRAERYAQADIDKVPQNFSNCEQYFKPCQFWSQCYGQNYSDAHKGFELYNSEDIPNLNRQLDTDPYDPYDLY